MANTGENATMTVAGYGTRSVILESIGHGMSVVADSAEARNHKAFYTTKVTSGSFDLGIAFTSYAKYNSWVSWMREYLRRLANGQLGPMRVQMPKLGFDKIGVPSTSILFGDARRNVIYRADITFIGTSDPTETSTHNATISQFRLGSKDALVAPFFYPGGTQKAAGEGGDLYDWNKDMNAALQELQNPTDRDPDSPYLEDKDNPFNFTNTIVLPQEQGE